VHEFDFFPDRLLSPSLSIITALATAVPAHRHEQATIAAFAARMQTREPGEARKLRFLYRHSGIATRHSVLPDYSLAPEAWTFFTAPDPTPVSPSLEARMEVYDREAPRLALDAARQCLGEQDPSSITHLITVSCTGMRAPGLDLELMDALQLPSHTERLAIHFMGCYAAVQGLKTADQICARHAEARVLIVCVELCTLHFQTEPTEDNIMSTLLFADGAAAALVENKGTGFHLDYFYSEVIRNGHNAMSWALSSTGFQMQLSGYVPELIGTDIRSLITRALNRNNLPAEAIKHWCVHPGGTRILDAVQRALDLPEDTLAHSYAVLQQVGNMSSPTILFVLKRWEEQFRNESTPSSEPLLGLAFGPGLTMETFIAHYA